MTRCFCGCGATRRLQWHHVVYQQELRRVVRSEHRGSPGYFNGAPHDVAREIALLGSRRNLVAVGPTCHAAHHNRSRPYRLSTLPDSAFEFAAEVLGAAPAYEYLKRRYAGSDMRLERLLEDVAA